MNENNMLVEKKGFAITGMVLGIVSLVLALILGIILSLITAAMGIIGLVFSIIAVVKKMGGKGMAITGIVLNIIAIVWSLYVYFVVVAALGSAINSLNSL